MIFFLPLSCFHFMRESSLLNQIEERNYSSDSNDIRCLQVECARCHVELQFPLPNHPAYIQCWSCGAKMLIQPLPRGDIEAEQTAEDLSGLEV